MDERIWTTAEILDQSGPMTADELAAQLKLSGKTVRSLIKTYAKEMQENGFCITAKPGRGFGIESTDAQTYVSGSKPQQGEQTGHTPKNVISDETIEYVGILAKLELSEEEKEQAKKDMGEMLDYIDKLNELDTEGVEPMSHVFPVNNVFREDVVTNGDGSADTLANAPVKKDGGFKVPKTIS